MEEEKRETWIWLADWTAEDKEEPVLALFRKTLQILERPIKAKIRISADSRYKLYVNGMLAEVGPSKGDRQVWFYDEVNILPYLQQGENIIAVQVLRYPLDHSKGNHGIFRTEYPGLFVEGQIWDDGGNQYLLDGNKEWKGIKDSGFQIVSESDIFAPLQIYENREGIERFKGWMQVGYKEEGWKPVREYFDRSKAVSPGNLLPRTIPYLYRKECKFKEVVTVRRSVRDKSEWEKLLWESNCIQIPAHTREIIEISAGEEMTGYLTLVMQGGKDSRVTLLQSEAYVQKERRGNLPIKCKRNDFINGHLEGFSDNYLVSGYGTEQTEEIYEPFWFRTFRFIRLEVITQEKPLKISRFNYTETGYPLVVDTKVNTSKQEFDKIWDISERTLRRCMHETYEDCPFYEQLQYAMDSRSQILYTYSVAADDRLARKCMDDFKRSQRYDGLLNCSYPCYGANVIPGFSIYYILMLFDHMMYFGDKEFLEYHMPAVEGILLYFHRNLEDAGYVKKIGGVNGKARYWSFIDWAKEWEETAGVPTATLNGAITMESLLYIMGLQHGAKIAEYLGRTWQSDQYLDRANHVKAAVIKHCTCSTGMLSDGPGFEQYSQHVQVFAVLTDTVPQEQGRKNLEETIMYKDKYAQCSVAMAFYLFRAFEKVGIYAKTEEYWELWEKMITNEVTTCVEDGVGERSDCHAWGALLLYELPTVLLGVQPAKPGYEAVMINPETSYLEAAQGSVITPKGMIHVKWRKTDELELVYEVPENLEVLF